jgi:hypothetical protein
MKVAQNLLQLEAKTLPPFYIITQQRQSPTKAGLFGNAITGLVRSIGLEHPELPLAMLDIDPESSLDANVQVHITTHIC